VHHTKTLTGIKSYEVYLLQNRRTKARSFTVCKCKHEAPKSPNKQGQKNNLLGKILQYLSIRKKSEAVLLTNKADIWLPKCLILIVPTR